jgi:hypothetical protein
MSLLSDNEMRDVCRRFVSVKRQSSAVVIELDTVSAMRWLETLGWRDRSGQQVVEEVMEYVSAVADEVLAESRRKLRSGEPVEGIDPDSP